MSAKSTAKASPCGCPPVDPAAFPSWSPAKGGGCGCGSGGGCGCKESSDPGQGSCTSGTPEATKRAGVVTGGCLAPRPRFFPGELVTDADLTAAVDYHRAQRQLSNGVIGGWGVYCGFALCIDEDTCTVCVGPGVAMDGLGRTIVNDATTCIKRPDPAQVDPKATCDPCAPRPDESLYLAIVYDDCLDGAKPRYGSVCGPGPDPGCDFSRVRERGRLVWIRNIDASYWISGCLPDPCGDPVGEPKKECYPEFDYERRKEGSGEPRLDVCTPCIGIRGGIGVESYARALDLHWALSRNVRLLTTEGAACGLGVATLIDVISGAACEPCSGEAVVVLALVTFTTSSNGAPSVQVQPLRRRVLSNANLTYLVEWLMEYVICTRRANNATAEDQPPSASATCTDPCVQEKDVAERIVTAAVGDDSDEERRARAQAQAAWFITYAGKRTVADFDSLAFRHVLAAAYPTQKEFDEAEADALLRYYDLVGRVGREAAIQQGVEFLYPKGVPEEKRQAVEDAVYAFLKSNRAEALATVPAPDVLDLANRINEKVLGRGAYPQKQRDRITEVLPGTPGAHDLEVATLRRRLNELEQEIGRIGNASRGTKRARPVPKVIDLAEEPPEDEPTPPTTRPRKVK